MHGKSQEGRRDTNEPDRNSIIRSPPEAAVRRRVGDTADRLGIVPPRLGTGVDHRHGTQSRDLRLLLWLLRIDRGGLRPGSSSAASCVRKVWYGWCRSRWTRFSE